MSNFWSGMIVMDPSVIDRHFDDGDTLGSVLVTGSDEPSEENLGQIEIIRTILDRLPPREADFIDLYFFQRVRQTVIASLFNVSQPTICYRLQRATERIKFLLQMPTMEDGELERVLGHLLRESDAAREEVARLDAMMLTKDNDREERKALSQRRTAVQSHVLLDALDVEIMRGMLQTTCQSEVAKGLGVSQGLVRHRFFRTLSKLEAIPDMEKYVQAFRLVASNLNIMREVYRAEWAEPVIYLVM